MSDKQDSDESAKLFISTTTFLSSSSCGAGVAVTDIILEAACGELIRAHTSILCTRSMYMRALIEGPRAENVNGILRMEYSSTAIKALLRFLYTSEVDEEALALDLGGIVDLASKHEQEGLRAACEKAALQTLTVKTIVPILVMAFLQDLHAVKEACFQLIREKTAQIILSQAFMRLRNKQPVLWAELRVALGLSQVEEDSDEEEEGEEEEEEEEEEVVGTLKRPRILS